MKGTSEGRELERLLPLPFGGNGNHNSKKTRGGGKRILATSFTFVGVLLVMLVSFHSWTLNKLDDTTEITLASTLTHLDTTYDVVNIEEKEEKDDGNDSIYDVEEEGTIVTTKSSFRVPAPVPALSLIGRNSAPALALTGRKNFVAGACTGTAKLDICGQGEYKFYQNKDECRPGRQAGLVGLQSGQVGVEFVGWNRWVSPILDNLYGRYYNVHGWWRNLEDLGGSYLRVGASFYKEACMAELAEGGSVVAAVSGPLVIVGIIVATIVAVGIAIIASSFWHGITDTGAKCTCSDRYMNGCKKDEGCDGKIVFGQYQTWNERGTGNVHIWSNRDNKKYPCKDTAFDKECIAECTYLLMFVIQLFFFVNTVPTHNLAFVS